MEPVSRSQSYRKSVEGAETDMCKPGDQLRETLPSRVSPTNSKTYFAWGSKTYFTHMQINSLIWGKTVKKTHFDEDKILNSILMSCVVGRSSPVFVFVSACCDWACVMFYISYRIIKRTFHSLLMQWIEKHYSFLCFDFKPQHEV